MKGWLKRLWWGIGLLMLPLLVTGVVGYSDTHLKLDYCKTLVSYQGGLAGIQENQMLSQIFLTDHNGKLTGNIQALNIDLWHQRIKSFDQLFQDENGTLYVACTLHGSEGKETKAVYQADFQWEILRPVWEVAQEEVEGSFQSQQLFSVIDGQLYFTLYEDSSNQLLTYAKKPGEEAVQVSATSRRGCEPEQYLYTEKGLLTLYRDQGIFLQEERIYPQSDQSNLLLNGLGYEDGVVSCLDLYQQQAVWIYLDTDVVASQPVQSQLDLTKMQNVHSHLDGGFSASLERGNTLMGIYWDHTGVRTFQNLKGELQWRIIGFCFLLSLLLELMILGILWVFWVRRRAGRRKGERYFLSVRIRISLISIAIVVVGAAVITVMSGLFMKEYSRQRQKMDSANAVQSLLGMLERTAKLEPSGESKGFSLEFIQKLNSWISDQNANGVDYRYELFLRENGVWYCVYSANLTTPALAEHVMTSHNLVYCNQAVEKDVIQSFGDRRSVGILRYAVSPADFTLPGGENCALVAASITDGYGQQVMILEAVLLLLRVVAITWLILLVVENLLIWLFMNRLRRLNRELAQSATQGEWKITDFAGRDEVAETAQTMKAMTGSIQVYLKDIRTCNAQYELLIPKDMIRLMGADSFTQVQAGQRVQREVTLLTLSLHSNPSETFSQLLKEGLEVVRCQQGMLVRFDLHKIRCCFLQREQALAALGQLLAHPVLGHYGTFFFAPATLEVGVIGNESVKYVLTLSEEGRLLRCLEEQWTGPNYKGFFLGQKDWRIKTGLPGYFSRLGGWVEGRPFFQLLPQKENPLAFATKKSFERGLGRLRKGDYEGAMELFDSICHGDNQDALAAYYRLECEKRLEEEGR